MIDKLIITRLLRDENYARKVLPYLKPEYFGSNTPTRIAYELIRAYIERYVKLPTPDALVVELTNLNGISEDLYKESAALLEEVVSSDTDVTNEWLIDQTEEFCRDKALHLALTQAIEIAADKSNRNLSRSSIPRIFQEALGVSFQPSIGHDYLADSDERYLYYTDKSKRIPFDLTVMNEITRGGLLGKTLNVVMASSGAGKSLFMIHCAAANLMMGKNVLYVTLELSSKMVGHRLDANLMGVDMGLMSSLPKDQYDKKIKEIRSKTSGRLVIEEFSGCNCAQLRNLLQELRIKKGFVPDIVYVDYINLMSATGKREMNSYEKVKQIAEDLRNIAIDYDIPIFTATQTNRAGYGQSSVGMDNVADSLGLPMTADLFLSLYQNEALELAKQYKVSQLKSRYDDKGKKPSFFLQVHKSTQHLSDVAGDGKFEDATDEAAEAIVDTLKRFDFAKFS